ncbi:hypothetical protein [Cryobacterium lactosi]|uniref:hypothetical protein n=1 Tax=Cryobacterium lactosi TaxID=1259202 RepID=UPI00141B7D2F|nr:hypothetical protein [Cryobacterium lactosi]
MRGEHGRVDRAGLPGDLGLEPLQLTVHVVIAGGIGVGGEHPALQRLHLGEGCGRAAR